MRMTKCRGCGAQIATSAERCPRCGGLTLDGAAGKFADGVAGAIDSVFLAALCVVGLVLVAAIVL